MPHTRYAVPLTTPQQLVVELMTSLPRLAVVPEMCGRLSMLHACTRMLPELQEVCHEHMQSVETGTCHVS
jgi:hypothetical protein